MRTRRTRDRRPPTTAPTKRQVHDAELIDETDELMDEIDKTLETNALEVTRAYRQKGGE
jgi:ubiquitin-like protein Pup